MSAQITVMKFGGTSLEDEQAFQRVAHIVASSLSANVVVVVSAMSGVTDALISSFQRGAKGETAEALQHLEPHFDRHLRVAATLATSALSRMRVVVEQSRREIVELLGDVHANRRTIAEGQDAMAAQGERLSANLLTIVLEGHGIPATYLDARRCIISNAEHGRATPLIEESWHQTRAEVWPLLETKRVPVLEGFIAAAKNRVTTTLGRGSSDYTATLVSAALGACETQIWTDVDGVMTADPSLVQSASTVSQLTYGEAAELARLGARVLHSKMIEPAVAQKIPIRILNSRAPERSGTLICAGPGPRNGPVKAIAHKTNLTRIDVTSVPALVANGFRGAITEIFNRHHAQSQIIATSEVGISFACEELSTLASLVQDLQQVGSVETKRLRAIISCVGEGLESADSSEKLLKVLREIDPALTWHSASSHSLLSMVDAGLIGPAVRRLHQNIFEKPVSNFGK